MKHVRVSGVWRQCSGVYANVGGTWREVKGHWCNVNGVWRGSNYKSFVGNLTDLDPATSNHSTNGTNYIARYKETRWHGMHSAPYIAMRIDNASERPSSLSFSGRNTVEFFGTGTPRDSFSMRWGAMQNIGDAGMTGQVIYDGFTGEKSHSLTRVSYSYPYYVGIFFDIKTEWTTTAGYYDINLNLDWIKLDGKVQPITLA